MNEYNFFPKAILSVNREEYYQEKDDPKPDSHQLPLQLTIKQGKSNDRTVLPAALQGCVFIIAPVASVDSPTVNPDNQKVVLPASDGWTSLLNGDGMIYRLEFNAGQATLSSRFVNTPSHYADRITHNNPDYDRLRFINLEVARMSLTLGQNNQINTAFLPVKFPADPSNRLLVTWDAGRPYEIDPESLKIIAPVGSLADWSPLIDLPIKFVFPQMMTSAHPALDPVTGEMFNTNVVKSLSTLISIANVFPFDVREWLSKELANYPKCLLELILKIASPVIDRLTQFLTKKVLEFTNFLENTLGLGSDDCLYLIRWDGKNALQKWPIVLADDRPISIQQTVHQIGITEDYILIADTSFKIVIEDLIPALNISQPQNRKRLLGKSKEAQKQEIEDIIKKLRPYLTYPQSPNTYLYIIDRAQLQKVPPGSKIQAQSIEIQREFAHFLTNYENPADKDGKKIITINAALNTATDAAEFIHREDISYYKESEIDSQLKNLSGMLTSGLAVNRSGFYQISIDREQNPNLEREELLDLKKSQENTWYLALYAYQNDRPTEPLQDIYQLSFGAWTNMLTELVYEMYENYPYRERKERLSAIVEQIKKGVPATLSHLKIDANAAPGKVLNIVDSYKFDRGYFASSPQFVPYTNPETGKPQNFIVCTVVHSDNLLSHAGGQSDPSNSWSNNSEIWMFETDRLQDGPQYRLSHPQLNLGVTLHTTWLPKAEPAPPREYNVREDFQQAVADCKKWLEESGRETLAQKVDSLFEQVYDEFERDRKKSD
ncbi:MAG: carotenoid oxygenase family protein [Oscillatoriaceae cyanobacterium Prado104]|jgi:hypothetical protein|nr:carotenoid oxygenase family protein [Oscillatoriaceae cyanobacterium Prado104]